MPEPAQGDTHKGMTISPDDGLAAHEAWLLAYARDIRAGERGDPAPLLLKEAHTARVLALARDIVAAEGISGSARRACLLAALYHDAGRFAQYARFHTFRDAESCNHGLAGARLVHRQGRLAKEAREVRAAVLGAIALHNRFGLPAGLPPLMDTCLAVVRDADKLDILAILHAHLEAAPAGGHDTVILSLPDDGRPPAAKVAAAALTGQVAAYADLRCVNDFRLLLGTWFSELHFAASRHRYLADGHGRALVAGVPKTGAWAAPRAALLKRLSEAGKTVCPANNLAAQEAKEEFFERSGEPSGKAMSFTTHLKNHSLPET